MRFSIIVLVCLIALSSVEASIVINQVLVFPEDGVEAVELFNPSTERIDISGWRIATKTSDHDAVIPRGTFLDPQQFYLITDPGWNTSSYREADLTESLTLANNNAGIALFDTTSRIDALGWGEPPSIFVAGTAASAPHEGFSLSRVNYTHDNSADFEEQTPFFPPDSSIRIITTITRTTLSILNATIEDDDISASGTQLFPFPGRDRAVVITFFDNLPDTASITFNNSSYRIVNGSASFSIPFTLSPGEYTVMITARGHSENISFTLLPINHISLLSSHSSIGEVGRATMLKNTGNTILDVELRAHELVGDRGSIDSSQLEYSLDDEHYFSFDNALTMIDTGILPGDTQALYLRILPSLFTPPGRYRGYIEVVGVTR